jgi:RNA polymerase sigma-70 factor (ECF subfamily)
MDRPLVERARGGDREAFEAIVRGKVDAVYGTALAILGDEADAQDAAQEAFIAAWRSFGSLRDPDRFEASFGRILVSACRMSLRRRRVRQIEVVPLTSSGSASAVPGRGSSRPRRSPA